MSSIPENEELLRELLVGDKIWPVVIDRSLTDKELNAGKDEDGGDILNCSIEMFSYLRQQMREPSIASEVIPSMSMLPHFCVEIEFELDEEV